jgi:hypothetical protein
LAVVVIDACRAAATTELHHKQLRIMSMIYCRVASLDEVMGVPKQPDRASSSPPRDPAAGRSASHP